MIDLLLESVLTPPCGHEATAFILVMDKLVNLICTEITGLNGVLQLMEHAAHQ